MSDKYFASAQGDELIGNITEKIKRFYDWVEKSGQGRLWRKSYDLYYGDHVEGQSGSELSDVGEDSELTAFGVNYYRNLVRHVLALTCAQKPAYDFRAVNSDVKSTQQARLANNIIDMYLVEKRLGRHQKLAAEKSLVFKVGYTYTTWNPAGGRPYAVDQRETSSGEIHEKVVYEGDADICSPSPWHVGYDPNLKDWTKNKWVWVLGFENKFDLATRYPEKADEIISLDPQSVIDDINFKRFTSLEFVDADAESELIPVFEFYHLPTDALPEGKYVKFCGSGTALYEGAYQYKKKLPIQRITPGEKFDSAEGYSEFKDIMVLQTVLNTLYSTVFNNQQAFGVQAIWMPEGCNLSTEQMGQGLAVLKGGLPGTKPEALQLTATPAEIFKNMDYVEKAMEKIVGINSVIRGDPDHSLKSGVALGRLQAMAIQFSSNFQQAWAEIQEDVGTFLMYILQDYAKTERMVAIAGKFNRGTMKSFTGKDLDLIDRVVCDLGNPLSRTFSGRMELADKFYEKGEINAKQYIQVIQTGQVDSVFQGEEIRLELPQKENEILRDGQPVKAMVGDLHILHAKEHGALLADPELRERANAGEPEAVQIVKNVMDHIMEHKSFHESQQPFWFVVSGEQPPPPQAGPPPGGPGGPGGPPPPPMEGWQDPSQMGPPPGNMPDGMAVPPPVPPLPTGL